MRKEIAAKYIAPINETELMCRMIEAACGYEETGGRMMELKDKILDDVVKRWATVQIMANDPEIAKDCYAMACLIKELTAKLKELEEALEEIAAECQTIAREALSKTKESV
jgi:hypothetical protein